MKLPPRFYARPAELVAQELLGARLVRRFDDGRLAIGRIVETEAYLGPHDLASHSRSGRTPRNAAMFGPPGRAYVFRVYGLHACLNVVTGAGTGAAVLLRALEPVRLLERPRGPGRLTRELQLDLGWNGESLRGPRLWLEAGDAPPEPIRATARIGVEYARAWARRRLRFCLRGNPWVSGPKGWR